MTAATRLLWTPALRGAGQVVGRVRRREHLVDDVNDAVAGGHVREGDVCIVDHDTIADGKRSGWPLTALAVMHSVTLAAGTLAPTTW